MFFNFYFIILMIRIFSDCKISYTFPIHKTLAEFFFAKAENVLPAAISHCLSAVFARHKYNKCVGVYKIMCIAIPDLYNYLPVSCACREYGSGIVRMVKFFMTVVMFIFCWQKQRL